MKSELQTEQQPLEPANKPSISWDFKTAVYAALPWVVAFITFVVLNHEADTQTVVKSLTMGDARATTKAKWLWLIPAATSAVGLITAFFTGWRNRLLAGFVAPVISAILAMLSPAALLPYLAVPAVAVGYLAFRKHEDDSRSWRQYVPIAIFTWIIAVAAYKRQEALYIMVHQPTDPDFEGYMHFARESFGWNTKYREPLFIWLLQFVDFIGGDLTPVMQRLTSLATGLAAVGAIFYLAVTRLNLLIAIIAASLYAVQEYPVFNCCRGLREDSEVFTTFMFIAISWHHLRSPVTWRSLTVWGLAAAACSLLRISSFTFTTLVVVMTALFRFYKDIKPMALRLRWLLPVLISTSLLAPYLCHCKQTYNDPFFVIKYHVRFYANYEFAGRHPDFPSREEIAKDGYAGGPMSAGKYIFGYHSTSEVAERTWNGFERVFFTRNLLVGFSLREHQAQYNLLSILNIIGVILLLFPRHIYLVLCMLLFNAPLFFLASFPYFDPRLMIVAMVFIYIAIGSAFGLSLSYGYRFLKSDSTSGPTYGKRSRTAAAANTHKRKKGAVQARSR